MKFDAMSKAKRPRAASLDDATADLKGLKAKVREKVVNGQPLSRAGRDNNLEAREIQMKIAALEAKAAHADAAQDPDTPGKQQKVRKQMEALRRRIKS